MGSQQRNVAMKTRRSEKNSSNRSCSRNFSKILFPSITNLTSPDIVMAPVLVLSFLLHCSVAMTSAYRLEPSPQTNSIFPPKSSIDSSLPSLSHLSLSQTTSKKHGVKDMKIYYQSGNSEASLPVCSPNSVCNKLDTYSSPWVEKQCRCPQGMNSCSTSTHIRDGHTITDRNRQYKVCEPVKTLKKCKYFRDVTWTYISYPDNTTQQIMHCRCPKNSVAYLIKRHAYQTVTGTGYQYSFACSPQTKIKCQRKEPCKLFSVRKNYDRPTADEVNTSSLCQCPHKKKCPKHHLDVGVIPGKIYSDDSVRTYSAYCM